MARIRVMRIGAEVVVTFATKSADEAQWLADSFDKQIKEGRINLTFPPLIATKHQEKAVVAAVPPARQRH